MVSILRTGWMTRPAENPINAVSMAAISNCQSKYFWTSASPMNITIAGPVSSSDQQKAEYRDSLKDGSTS
jgi:hypothetical protein